MNWYVEVLRKYAVFEGRARRMEYWMFVLFNMLIAAALGIVDSALGLRLTNDAGVLGSLYSLAVLIPGIAVAVRRLHDTDRSGWWLFLVFVPLIGLIVLIVWLATDGQPGPNQFGVDPKSAPEPPMPGAAAQQRVSAGPPAGWYTDPTGRHQLRYWDASGWTSNVSDNGVSTTDPV